MFTGRFDHLFDEKGRVSIPARFREVLQRDGHDRLFVTNFIFSGERCLSLYSPAEWDQLNALLAEKQRFDPNLQAFEMYFIGGAFEAPVDRQGRVLVPERLRTYAKLGRAVTFSARRDHFQLWDKAVLDKVLGAAEEKIGEPDFYFRLGI
ncbi:MAG: division/cell wall cluster transcriptional repressor MraZ [Candidatus Binataceae bacterium]